MLQKSQDTSGKQIPESSTGKIDPPLQKQMMEIDTQFMNEVKEGNSAAVIVSMNAMRVGLVAPALADPARYPDLELPSMEKLVETSPKLKFVCDSVIANCSFNNFFLKFIYSIFT